MLYQLSYTPKAEAEVASDLLWRNPSLEDSSGRR